MTRLVHLFAPLLLGAATSCSAPVGPPDHAVLATRFGPIADLGTISGHVLQKDDASVILIAGDGSLVSIDADTGTYRRATLPCSGQDRCWGLARLADGSLWTLKGMHVVMEVSADARVVRELPLEAAHLGVHGAGLQLVLQPGTLPAGQPVLFSGSPSAASRDPWSTMRARPFDALATGAAAALNLVSCGVSLTAEIPCWFPDEPSLFLITAAGVTRTIALDGLPHPAPELLINARVPQRPVRDVFIEADGTIWVISTGQPVEGSPDVPGGWLIARYGRHGEPIDRRQLQEPIRIILRAAHGRALVLTGAGMVAEVQP
jgi:hypothetical protein